MEFLGLIFLIVYVGAICIIFLFVIMMIPGGNLKDQPPLRPTSKDFFFNYLESRKDLRPLQAQRKKGVDTHSSPAPSNTAIGVLIGAILAAELASAVPDSFFKNSKFSDILASQKKEYSLGGAPSDPGPDFNDSFFSLNGSGGSNLEAIGSVLYINYYYAFILVSFILLVAMIGAIVLGLQSSDQNKTGAP